VSFLTFHLPAAKEPAKGQWLPLLGPFWLCETFVDHRARFVNFRLLRASRSRCTVRARGSKTKPSWMV